MWEDYRWEIIVALSLCAVQTVLLVGILMQSARRRRAERELRESREDLTLAAEWADVGIWHWDLKLGRLSLSKRCRELLGLNGDQPLDFREFEAMVHPDDRQSHEAAIQTALVGKESYDAEYRVVRPDGLIRWVASRGLVEKDVTGQAVRAKGVLHDVTRRKQAEAELDLRREEAAHFSQIGSMGELAASISHELGQPLEAILNNTEAAQMLLASDPPALDEVRAILADIRVDDSRATDVIRKVRSLFQKHQFEPAVLSVRELFEEVIKLIDGMLGRRCVIVQVKCDEGLPRIRGDRLFLQQVFVNLAVNGMDAMMHLPTGQRVLSLSARRDERGDVEFLVADRGSGITPDRLPRLFDPFYTTKKEGSGLGLSLVRRIVQAHGGQAWAQNNRDRGATIGFTIPSAGGDT